MKKFLTLCTLLIIGNSTWTVMPGGRGPEVERGPQVERFFHILQEIRRAQDELLPRIEHNNEVNRISTNMRIQATTACSAIGYAAMSAAQLCPDGSAKNTALSVGAIFVAAPTIATYFWKRPGTGNTAVALGGAANGLAIAALASGYHPAFTIPAAGLALYGGAVSNVSALSQ